MNAKDEQVRAAIAEQAGAWFVANDEGPLNPEDSAALVAWLQASPVHVEEFLGVSVIARDLAKAGTDPESSLDALLARARAEDEVTIRPLWPRVAAAVFPAGRWLTAAATMAALSALTLGLLLFWSARPAREVSVSAGTSALHFATRHGEQVSRRLPDGSVLHLNTDSAATVRFDGVQRLVVLTSGQAEFDVAHEPHRAFRVLAGSAEVVAVGTRFDVRMTSDATVVTVAEGRVAVGLSPNLPGHGSGAQPTPVVELGVNQQLRVAESAWPATPVAVDAEQATSWLRREIVFDHEPLERVAAELNRYAPKPIEITTPALKSLQISGVFATDDPDAFIAFLRSLKGVRVEVTATQIRVSRQ
jgi:transmembrane sensor